MKCPNCKGYAKILETRKTKQNTIRRRYECGKEHRFTTLEAVVIEENRDKLNAEQTQQG